MSVDRLSLLILQAERSSLKVVKWILDVLSANVLLVPPINRTFQIRPLFSFQKYQRPRSFFVAPENALLILDC